MVYEYLSLLRDRYHNKVQIHDISKAQGLAQIYRTTKDYSKEARPYRAIAIFAKDWIFFPMLKQAHFAVVVACPSTTGPNTIKLYDSFHTNIWDDEVNGIHELLQHMANDRKVPLFANWEIDLNAGHIMGKQLDGHSCGIYSMMVATCLMANIPLTLINNANMVSARPHVAHCLLNTSFILLKTANMIDGTTRLVPDNGISTSEETKVEEEPISRTITRSHYDDDDDAEIPAIQYQLLDPDYTWTPSRFHMEECHTHKFKVPPLPHNARNRLAQIAYDLNPSPVQGIEHQDFMDLLKPDSLTQTPVDTLLRMGLSKYTDDITFVPTAATYEFSTGNRKQYQRLVDANGMWTDTRRKLLTSNEAVILFGTDKHYKTVIVHRRDRTISYLDSIKTNLYASPPPEVQLVLKLYEDEGIRQQIPTNISNYRLKYPAEFMTPQQPYLLPLQHPDMAQHIDCGPYAILMTLLHIENLPVECLTPSAVHNFRQHAANLLQSETTTFDINTLVFPLKRPPTSTFIIPSAQTPQPDCPIPDDTRIQSLRPRKSRNKEIHERIPRERANIINHDPSRLFTYVAQSTIHGAQYGIFADCLFDDDNYLIGEYYGGENLTRSDIYAEGYYKDYAIEKGPIIRDAYCRKMKRVLCNPAYTNDPLDEEKENSIWMVENRKLYMEVKPGCTIPPDNEVMISYGEQAWCSTKFPFELLQKAVWRYRKDIDISENGHWPNHAQAHELFNTPYNGNLPFKFTKCPCTGCRTGTRTVSTILPIELSTKAPTVEDTTLPCPVFQSMKSLKKRTIPQPTTETKRTNRQKSPLRTTSATPTIPTKSK